MGQGKMTISPTRSCDSQSQKGSGSSQFGERNLRTNKGTERITDNGSSADVTETFLKKAGGRQKKKTGEVSKELLLNVSQKPRSKQS